MSQRFHHVLRIKYEGPVNTAIWIALAVLPALPWYLLVGLAM